MFDPYHKWLGIPREKQPANYYQLLGLQPGESDPEVIEDAAIRQSAHVRGYQLGPHAALCTKLLNEIAEAKNVLLNPNKRAAYEAQLARSMPAAAAQVAAVAATPQTVSRTDAVVTVRKPRVEVDDDFDDVEENRPRKRRRAKGARSIKKDSNWLAIKIAIGSGAAVLLIAVVVAVALSMRDKPAPPQVAVQKAKVAKVDPKVDPVVMPPVVRDPVRNPVVEDPPAPKPKEAPVKVVPPGERFQDRGDHVEDMQTGLLWQKDGAASGRRHFFDAMKYSTEVKLANVFGWRVPKIEEIREIFPATDAPFANTKYNPNKCCGGGQEFPAYWTSNLDTQGPDYAFLYQWYEKGGANNCFASKNFAYVRCVHDPLKK